MTHDELINYFSDRVLPTGRVKYSSYESTDDLAAMVAGAIERVQRGGSDAATSRGVLERVKEYLENQTPE